MVLSWPENGKGEKAKSEDAIRRWRRKVESQGYYVGGDELPSQESFLNMMSLSLWMDEYLFEDEEGPDGQR